MDHNFSIKVYEQLEDNWEDIENVEEDSDNKSPNKNDVINSISTLNATKKPKKMNIKNEI